MVCALLLYMPDVMEDMEHITWKCHLPRKFGSVSLKLIRDFQSVLGKSLKKNVEIK